MEKEAKDRIIVALDFSSLEKAACLAEELGRSVGGYKVGLELLNSKGAPQVVQVIKTAVGRLDAGIFFDGKFMDISKTVAGAARAVTNLGVWAFNVHCLGGLAMMQAALVAAEEEAAMIGGLGGVKRPLVLGVTILTSLSYKDLTQMGFWRDLGRPDIFTVPLAQKMADEAEGLVVSNLVVKLANLAKDAGLDGVIASPREIRAIREACGSDFLIVTPGIRASGDPPDDQRRTATAAEAILAGTDYLVIGRPIVQAPDPRAAAEKIAEEIEEAIAGKEA